MKRSKRLIALAVLLLAVSGATFGLTKYETKKEEIQTSDAIILEIPADSVTSLSWKTDNASGGGADTEESSTSDSTDTDTTASSQSSASSGIPVTAAQKKALEATAEEGLSFHKSEDGWVYDEDENFPVDTDKVTDLLSHFEAFGVSFIIENVEDYSQYGLDKPECTISIATEDTTYEIKLGAFSKMDEQRYVDIGDGNVYLVSTDPLDYLASSLSDMILDDTMPAWDDVTDIQFAGAENYSITYVEESTDSYSAGDTYFTEKDGKNLPLDPSAISTYLKTIRTLSLNNHVSYHATEEELAAYGLDAPELSVTLHYTYTDEDEKEQSGSCILYIGQNAEELAAAKEAEENGEDTIPSVTSYVRMGSSTEDSQDASQIIYELDDSAYTVLAAASYNDLRHKEIFWGDFADVTQMDITLEDTTHTLTSVLDEDSDTRTWYYGEEELDLASLKSSIRALSTEDADSFTNETPSQKEEISLTLTLDNEAFPQVSIQLYRYDGASCLAVVDDETVSLIDRSQVVDLIEAVQAIVLGS